LLCPMLLGSSIVQGALVRTETGIRSSLEHIIKQSTAATAATQPFPSSPAALQEAAQERSQTPLTSGGAPPDAAADIPVSPGSPDVPLKTLKPATLPTEAVRLASRSASLLDSSRATLSLYVSSKHLS
jgi:hypothetical protein